MLQQGWAREDGVVKGVRRSREDKDRVVPLSGGPRVVRVRDRKQRAARPRLGDRVGFALVGMGFQSGRRERSGEDGGDGYMAV